MLKSWLNFSALTLSAAICLFAETPTRLQWRNGYVELSFPGEWPKESPRGAPGPVDAFLAGWIDGDSGKGRMRVQGRSVPNRNSGAGS
jgi:hypothetical protein